MNRFGPEYKAELARSCDCVINSGWMQKHKIGLKPTKTVSFTRLNTILCNLVSIFVVITIIDFCNQWICVSIFLCPNDACFLCLAVCVLICALYPPTVVTHTRHRYLPWIEGQTKRLRESWSFLTYLIFLRQIDSFEQIIFFARKCKFFVALTLSAKTFQYE